MVNVFENINKLSNKLTYYTNIVKTIYPEKYQTILANQFIIKPKTFRINLEYLSQKKEILTSLENKGFLIKPFLLPNSYISNNINVATDSNVKSLRLSDTDEFLSNKISIQELASMLPALNLDLEENLKVIDMCSAPGSKTKQIFDLTKGTARICAVEKSRDRFFKLRNNLKPFGIDKFDLENIDATRLIYKYPKIKHHFDRVLIDVPCSSEGRFNFSNPKSYKYWSKHKHKELSKIQKGLLLSGIKLLKPGGTLVYSTCTLNPYENEFVINWLLKKGLDISLEKVKTFDLPNVTEGVISYKDKNFNSSVSKSLRVIPTELFGGFYICKIKLNSLVGLK